MANRKLNGVMAVAGYGSKDVLVEAIGYGISIEAQTDDARNQRVFYMTRVVDDDFSLSLAFRSHDEFEGWAKWVAEYLRRLANGQLGPLRVRVPQFSFDKLGVPAGSSAVPFGDAVVPLVHRVDVSFIGAADPTAANDKNKAISQFRDAGNDTLIAPYFYPAGQKAVGGDDYDWTHDIQAMTDADLLGSEIGQAGDLTGAGE